jgi:hypothetical protein
MFATWLHQVGGKLKQNLLTDASVFDGRYGLVGMILFLINHRSNLLCRDFTEERTSSASGLSCKVMIRTRRRSPWRSKMSRWWSCRFLPTMDGDEAIEFVLKISSFVVQWVALFSLLRHFGELCDNQVVAFTEVKSQTFPLSKKNEYT